MPSSPGSQDSALPQNQVQPGVAAGQPGWSLDTAKMPVEEDCSVPAEGSDSTGSGIDSRAQRNPVPCDPNTTKPPVDKGLPEGEGSSPALSASEGHPDAFQKAPLPVSATQAASEVSSREWRHGGGPQLMPLAMWVRCLPFFLACASVDRAGQSRVPFSVTYLTAGAD